MTQKSKNGTLLLVLTGLLCFIHSAMAQTIEVPDQGPLPAKSAHAYIKLNKAATDEGIEHTFVGDTLRFCYAETNQKQVGTLYYRLVDWKKQVVKRGQLSKKAGLNQFAIPVSTEIKTEESYTLIISTGNNSFSTLVRRMEVSPLGAVRITAKVGKVDCAQESTIVYKGYFSGGRGPFHTVWHISSDLRNSQNLGKTQEATIDSPAALNPLEVIGPLDYYVTLAITDACGNKKQQVAHVTCSENQRRYGIAVEVIPPINSKNNTQQ